jgi:dihydroorotase
VTTLTIAGGRVLDPGQGLDTTADVVIDGAVISAVGAAAGRDAGLPAPGGETIDAGGLLVVPGLVDLHTHLYLGVSHYGIDADRHCLGRGVTTAVDAGSSGAQTFPGLRRFIIEPSETRILAFLHVAVQGLITNLVGELEDTRWASPDQAAARARENADAIVGIKVRLGYQMVGDDPGPAMRLAREAADQTGLPLMVHVIDMRPSVSWLLPRLRRGDIVTHCFHGNPGGILDGDGRLVPGVAEARQRGVLFDVGHGVGSFSYRVARSALAQGFAPDTISSDLHAHNVDGPAWDQATTLSKLLHVGMGLPDVIRSTTTTPAAAVRRGGSLGALAPGREADLTVLQLAAGAWRLPDAAGQSEVVERLLVPRFAVRAGRVHRLGPPPAAGAAWPQVQQAAQEAAGGGASGN